VDGTDEPKLFQECYGIATRIINSMDVMEYEEECALQNRPCVSYFYKLLL
jgi:hypothetical protein